MPFCVLFNYKIAVFSFRKVTNFAKRKGQSNFISLGLILLKLLLLKNQEVFEMKGIKKTLCLLLSLVMILSMGVPAFALEKSTSEAQANTTSSETSLFSIELSTDKGSYSATGIAKITAKVTNTSGKDIKNVCAEAVFGELAPCKKKSSQTTAEAETLKDGESLEFTYSATINKNAKKLNIIEKIILFFVRLFNGGYSAKDNGFDNGREFVESSNDIKFGKRWARNTVKVWFGVSGETPDNPPTQDKLYEELIKDVDIDEIYEYDESDISIDETTGIGYINNIITIMFEEECSDSDKAKIINSINGKIIGGNKTYNELYIKIEKSTCEELDIICDKLNENDNIYAYYSEVFENISNAVPNDPYASQSEIEESDDEPCVKWDGKYAPRNWGLIAINAPDSWNYNNYFSNIKIGVIDDGFNVNHIDLDIKTISKKNSKNEHGTHVAGIIGATANNTKGITGIVWNKTLYGYDAEQYNKKSGRDIYTDDEIYNGLEKLVKKGCKVINCSFGLSQNLLDSNCNFDKKTINKRGKTASKKMATLLKKRYDFIVVQAAGNGATNPKYVGQGSVGYNDAKLGVDAINNGYFASITKDNCYSRKISAEEIMSRIIIVTSAESNINDRSKYNIAISANGGSQVDISAPGENIYSTVLSNEYSFLSGTSMAAPMVAGVASLVWSINSDFTGAQVKDIVCKNVDYNTMVYDNLQSPNATGNFRMVNAKFAVEEAMRRTYGEESVTNFAGGDGSEENPYQVATPAQLNAVRYHLDKHFIQIADIDLSDWGEWKPIGKAISYSAIVGGRPGPQYEENLFTGSYNGNSFLISNLKIIDSKISPHYDCYGLFAGAEDGVFKNIKLTNVNININKSSTDYEKIYSDEDIEYSISVGSIVGINSGDNASIINCSANGEITINNGGDVFAGGIVGEGENNLYGCDSSVTINVNSKIDNAWLPTTVYCGGIAGTNCASSALNGVCTNYGNISAKANYVSVGGIIGQGSAAENCVNFGNLSSSYGCCNIGGIIGNAYSKRGVKNAINYGNITAYNEYSANPTYILVGGIIGQGFGGIPLKGCYNKAQRIIATSLLYVGARHSCFIGACGYAEFSNCYSVNSYTLDENTEHDNITIISDEAFLKEETYKGFDFDNIWKIDSSVGGAVLK